VAAGVRVRMERLARVASLWTWLPGFRAVAETENVHEAARRLAMSPSSLSRTIRLLEERLEQPLFERAGRRMHLTPLGRQLLGVVRDAMRSVDDATAARDGVLRLAAAADLVAAFVVPHLAALGVTTRMSADPDVDPCGRLLRGELDVVIACRPVQHRRVVTDAAGHASVGIYVSAHAASGVPATIAEALQRPFVTYHAAGGIADHWPAMLERTITLETQGPLDAALAASSTDLAVALPDRLVKHLALPLRRVHPSPHPPIPLYATRRCSLGPVHHADALVRALRGDRG